MRKNFILWLSLTAAIISLPWQAMAIEGYYLQVGGGGMFVEDTPIRGGSIDNDVEFNWGWGTAASFGYQYDNGIRTEIEGAYRSVDVESISFASPGGGDIRVSTIMANILFDLDIMDDSRIMPYIGGGAGLAYTDFHDVTPVGVTTSQTVDDTDIAPALQAIVGMNYALSPTTDLYTNYHFMSVLSPEFTTSNLVSVSANYDSSSLFVGVRFALGGGDKEQPQALTKDVPASAPSPISRTYLVFFDWNSYDLSQEAQAILYEAAQDAKSGNAVAVEVRGHADRSGSADYNMQLSQKRADTVRDYLSKNGIPAAKIETRALGESEPLVATGDGIRDPRNRRAEVVYVIDMQG